MSPFRTDPPGEVLLDPSIIYTPAVLDAVAGGGVRGPPSPRDRRGDRRQPGRILPERTGAVIRSVAWEVPRVFRVLQDLGAYPRTRCGLRSTWGWGTWPW